MHRDSEESQAIHSSVTALGLLRKKKEERRITKCMGGAIQNTNLQRDSDKVKGCSKRGRPCTACIDGLNRDILQHNKEIW